jgi:hypothetical protein
MRSSVINLLRDLHLPTPQTEKKEATIEISFFRSSCYFCLIKAEIKLSWYLWWSWIIKRLNNKSCIFQSLIKEKRNRFRQKRHVTWNRRSNSKTMGTMDYGVLDEKTRRYVMLRCVTWRVVSWRDVSWRVVTCRDVTWRDVTWCDVTWLTIWPTRKMVFFCFTPNRGYRLSSFALSNVFLLFY